MMKRKKMRHGSGHSRAHRSRVLASPGHEQASGKYTVSQLFPGMSWCDCLNRHFQWLI